MRLRSQILLLLFLFGLTPLLVALAINIPLVFQRLELFYHKAYLQNLRADFRDLDAHLTSRREIVRLLAKLPEPGVILNNEEHPEQSIEVERAQYVDWVNRLMRDQPDIIQIVFLDKHGKPQFWLERERRTLELKPEPELPSLPPTELVRSVMRIQPGAALGSPITINPEAADTDPTRYMTLWLGSAIFAPSTPPDRFAPPGPRLGMVAISIDIGGMARVYPNTYWVHNDGRYLRHSWSAPSGGTAFEDFPGLQESFSDGVLGLWRGGDEDQVIWIPLFATERSGPLWVGRRVDPSPITSLGHALEIRIGLILLALIAVILIIARWFALRAERFGGELTDRISRILEHDEPVEFTWRGPQELRVLGEGLTRLASTHAQNSQAMREHARELEESNRYKSEFLANMSHELRTPLNSILLLSKLLADDEQHAPSAEQVKQLRVIHKAGTDLMALINNILDLSRIEANKCTLEVDEVDLNELLEGLRELFQPLFDDKGLSFEVDIAHDAPRSILTDGDKVSQILKNFLSNAVKFTSRGGVLVRLASNTGPKVRRCPVRISVQDTGIGIPSDKQGYIFEAFEQVDGSSSRRYGGTGLGLAISRELARLLGGFIELESEQGKGSTFSLVLPMELDRSRSDANERAAREPAGPETSAPEADFSGNSVLLLDNDLRDLLVLTPLLEGWGLRVMAAADGREAQDVLGAQDRFDLVFIDIMMPDTDGYEIIRRIRAMPGGGELPIILLTANAAPEADYLQAGADDLLTKPVEPAALKDILSRYLSSETTAMPN